MNVKITITVLLSLFVVASVGMMLVRGLNPSVESSGDRGALTLSSDQALVRPDANVDVVYYFMTSQRCENCIKIESYTREVVMNSFSDRIGDNRMLWKMVDVDAPQNRHFIQDYQLITKSVVLVRYRDGKPVEWKNLDEIWNLLGDKGAFQEYINHEVNSFIQDS